MSNRQIFSLKDGESARLSITNDVLKKIQGLFQDIASEFEKQAKSMDIVTVSDSIRQTQLVNMSNELKAKSKTVYSDIQSLIKNGMYNVSEGIVSDANKFNALFGLPSTGAFGNVPTDVVANIISGNVYDGKWSLSNAIWKNYEKTRKDIDFILAKGLSENKGSYEIAKDLEKYVNPSVKKDWNWSKVYPGTNKKIEYNSQRLARTLISHAYQQSTIEVCRDNPFVNGIKWLSAFSSRTCELCMSRDGKIYPKDDVPMDHPNGLCTFVPAINKSYEEIGNEISDWLDGGENQELDIWYKKMYKS